MCGEWPGRGGETRMPVTSSTVLGTLALAVIAVTVLWRWFGPVIVLSAMGVAWVGQLLTGARFARGGLWLHSKDHSWFLFAKDQGWWLSRFFVALIVLPTPSVIGLLLARGVDIGWSSHTVIVVLIILVGLLALGHANWQTLLLITAVCGLLAVFLVSAGVRAQVGAIIGFSWFFLLGGLRLNIEEAGRKHSQGAPSFPGALQRLTDVPGLVWMLGFLLIAVASTITGSRWLLAMT